MEKKKLLLVAISVGVFLVIVIGVSILAFSPRTPSPAAVKPAKPAPAEKAEEQPEAPETPASVNAVELVKGFDDIQGLQAVPEEKPQDNVFYIYGENPGELVTVERSSGGSENRLVVDVPRPSAVAVPDTPRVAAKPVPAPAARQTPATAARKTPAAAPAPKAAPAPTKARDNYWVQTGSFSTIARAEAVKDTLSAKGISSLVENREVQGKTYFRVRVGPYVSKNEADYWLALIKSIHGFEESLVFKAPAR
jgi:DedD protein